MMLVKNTLKLATMSKKSYNNITMRTFIIFFNFLLITLILYSFLTSNIVEQFGSGCTPSQKSAVYKNQALIDRLFSEMNTVKAEYNQLNTQSATNKILIQANAGKMRSTTAKVEEGRKEKEKELDDLEKENDSGPTKAPPIPTSKSGAQFGAAMKGGASSF